MEKLDLQLELENILRTVARRLHAAGLPDDSAVKFENLAEQVHQPCVVAVMGRVNTGKSTLINALMGINVATVGDIETTSTITHFHYGRPDPDHPFRCYWRDHGSVTLVDSNFVSHLQDINRKEALDQAELIHHLDYHLEQITLLDMPGQGSVITTHNQALGSFLEQETERWARDADALIYLTDEIGRGTDHECIKVFQQVTQSQKHALNAIGVLTKIDDNPGKVQGRQKLATGIATQLQQFLHTVIPVSAGIHLALHNLLANNRIALKQMIEWLKLKHIDEATLKLLVDETYWEDDEQTNFSIQKTEWEQLLDLVNCRHMSVINTIAGIVVSHISNKAAPEILDNDKIEGDIIEELEEIAGFKQLHAKIDQYFVKRGRYLRSYRIVNEALQSLVIIRRKYQSLFRQRIAEDTSRQNNLLVFIQQIQSPSSIAQELEALVNEYISSRKGLEKFEELTNSLEHIKNELDGYHSDFECLQLMEKHRNLFASRVEFEELQILFGLHIFEIEKRLPSDQLTPKHLACRQCHWNHERFSNSNSAIRKIAEHADIRYGQIRKTLNDR